MAKRVKIATDFLKQRVVQNIKRPITKIKRREKGTGKFQKSIAKDRSKPGEFPKADTTHLMKTIIGNTSKVPGGWEGIVGTPLDYGVILEIKKDRSFLLRTFNENNALIMKLLTGPIPGAM